MLKASTGKKVVCYWVGQVGVEEFSVQLPLFIHNASLFLARELGT